MLHGLWLRAWVVEPLRRRLASTDMRAVSFGYPTVRRALDDNARDLAAFADRQPGDRLHFVGHSLGGLVVLRMLAIARPARIGRTVLLGSPCLGSHVVETLTKFPGATTILGFAIVQWQRDPVRRVPDGLEIAAIAGDRPVGIGHVVVPIEPPHDGAVRVAETRLPGLSDHLSLPVTHTGMLFSREVARQTGVYLRSGRFDHGRAS